MSSLRRIVASRANGSHSHGPSTPEGKARSAQNARTHSLTASMVLSNESDTQLQAMLDAYTTEFRPATATELDLIEEMATAKWRQRRLWNVETALLDHEMEKHKTEIAKIYKQIDEPTRAALAFQSLADNSTVLHNLSRYESRHRSAWYRAFNHLARNNRGINEPSPTNEHSDQPADSA